jgi:hypothetical protein
MASIIALIPNIWCSFSMAQIYKKKPPQKMGWFLIK